MSTRMVVIVGLLFGASATAADPTPVDALKAIETDWKAARKEYLRAYDTAKTAADRERLKSKYPDHAAFAGRYLKLADAHPGTNEELIALCWASLAAPESDAGKTATARLTSGRMDRATPKALHAALDAAPRGNATDGRLVPAVLARAKKSLDDPDTARLLSWVCLQYMNDNSDKPSALFAEAADLIVAKFADSPEIAHFCEALFLNGGPHWAGAFEKHLAVIVEKNKSPFILISARYGLASVAYGQGAAGQERAEKLFRRFVTDFDGDSVPEQFHPIRDALLRESRKSIKEIEVRGLGKPAPEIAGSDIDGRPLKLSDHKGKVVLLVFWASWCGPCLRDVPHEKELVETFKGRPFVLLGVSGDTDKDEAKGAIKRAGIPWRTFWDGPDRPHATAAAWAVSGWPTVLVIDHEGVIRENRLRGKRLDAPLEAYVAAAEKAGKR